MSKTERPEYPKTLRDYDEDTGMMRYPAEAERLGRSSITLEELGEKVATARSKYDVPTNYVSFVRAVYMGDDEPELAVWFGRPETEEEIAVRVQYAEDWSKWLGFLSSRTLHWIEDK